MSKHGPDSDEEHDEQQPAKVAKTTTSPKKTNPYVGAIDIRDALTSETVLDRWARRPARREQS